jgi:hypothetical protein
MGINLLNRRLSLDTSQYRFSYYEMENTVELNVNHLMSLKAARNFYENSQPITACDFDCTGEFCVTASADESINLYNCVQGR